MKIYLPTLIIVLIDQTTKVWIKNNIHVWESIDIIGTYLRFTHVKNPGIAFGISVGGYQLVVSILTIFATIFIAYMHWSEKNNHPLIVYGLGCILGGAIGNMIDRSFIFFSENYKGVVDFIDIGIGSARWFTFNIADTGVTIGVILYLFYSLLELKPELFKSNDRKL